MKKTAIMMTALTLAVLMSCDTGTGVDAKPDSGERVAVSFSTGINAARSAGRAVGTSWDSDDAIGIFMLERGGTGIVDSAANRQYSVSDAANGSFAPANRDATIYYPANQQGVDFIAYYPYASALQGFAYPVDVSDQTSQAKIDLMTAARVSIQGREPVALTFKHRLARLELEIKAGTNLTDADLRGLRAAITSQQTTGTYSISDNDLTPSGAGDRSIPLKMAANGKTGQGIILPGEAQAGRKFFFTLGFKQFGYTIPAAHEFKAGTRNKYTITLKGSAPSSSPGEVDISVEGEVTAVIEDWGEGITEEGEAEEEGGNGGNGTTNPGTGMVTVTYAVGSGSGTPPASQTVALNATIYLPDQENMEAPSGLTFYGWSINGQDYIPQATFTVRGNTAFTARWGFKQTLKTIVKPDIVNGENPHIINAPSFADDTGNTYVVHAGTLENVYLSTLDTTRFDGFTGSRQTWTVTTSNAQTVTTGLETNIATTISASLTTELKTNAGIEFGPVKAGLETSVSTTIGASSGYSTKNTKNTAEESAVGRTYTYEFTANDPKGFYRQALYAKICDVYFLFKTSPDKQTLLSWETVVCARAHPSGSCFSNLEYGGIDGEFNHENPSALIGYTESFWKNLPKPPPRELSTDQRLVRSTELTIVNDEDDGWFRGGHADPVKFSSFVQADSTLLPPKVDLKSLKDNGYKTVSFYVNLNVAEVDDGYQHIGLFKSRTETEMDLVQEQRFEHDGKKDIRWWTHDLNFQNISIDIFTLDEFVIRYMSTGNQNDVWKNKELKIKLVFRK